MPKQHVLGQKASAARRALEARGMSPAKALRRALSQTALVLWDLALQAHGLDIDTLDQDGVTDGLTECDLLVLLDGPDGAVGFAGFDRQILTGLIEVQTLLQVTGLPVDDRPVTATDAAMTAPLIDGALARFEDNLDDHPWRVRLAGFRFGAMIEDARSAALLLKAADYRVFRIALDMGLGQRQDDMQLVLPEPPPARADASGGDDEADSEGPHEALMMRVPARLDAVLCSVRMPLSQANALKPGDLIPLPPTALNDAVLWASGGTRVGGGRLGQMNGLRAVRLTWPAADGASPAPPDVAGTALEGGAVMAPDAGAPVPELPALEPEPAPPAVLGEEELPDLPPLDFPVEDEATPDFGALVADTADTSDAGGGGDDLGDFDFGAAPMGGDGGFAVDDADWSTD
ncbi:FliM/FliN family flagellar motor C-terminal domain-containing protein [Aestuariicoccus sp. MJ-SS9]|uniref:FliM/FliN family flagellar motor switch protein n=1 Tax=Aestuariicoccus sp. MJ-SS9 TaxID=3079855 RepID=UPI0029069519|nr:FliM/FliN family flagellar motor C-terminal domain-containing protein [Aestuariicoccus sp. MJ-SS9]MDU8913730.1 FliM/FliN family flagellar motor C-terminal domain-containing protein [Aestuariicoccus sp. MJ-SS9]